MTPETEGLKEYAPICLCTCHVRSLTECPLCWWKHKEARARAKEWASLAH